MHIVLLSGGSGTRLWPLSNNIKSKQFLKVLPCPDGKRESMLQRVYRQLSTVGGWETVSVAASADQTDEIGLQVGTEVNVIVEPERRNTFPAIALACAYLVSEKQAKLEDVVVFLPVDPYVEEGYFRKVRGMESCLQERQGAVAVLGIKPDYPSCEFGYILPQDDALVSKVKTFTEKPDKANAELLLAQGALWNSGVFAFPIRYIVDFLREHYNVADFTYAAVKENFSRLPRISFDYEVMEKEKSAVVARYDGLWKDLGTWESLSEELDFYSSGPVSADDTCVNTHIVNDTQIPLVAIGQKDCIIVAGRDGILVSQKGCSAKVKELANGFSTRPMREDRRWGKYEIIDCKQYRDGSQMLTKRLTIDPGKKLSYQYHEHRKEVWTVVDGEGILYLDGEKRSVKRGDVIKIAERQKHGIMAQTELEMIEVQLGVPLTEEDIVRLELDW